MQTVNTVKEPERPFFLSAQWAQEARDNVKKTKVTVKCNRGENVLHFYGMSPGVVLERILLVKKGIEIPKSYLGPGESYIRFLEEERDE